MTTKTRSSYEIDHTLLEIIALVSEFREATTNIMTGMNYRDSVATYVQRLRDITEVI